MAKIAPQSPGRNKIKLKENEKEGKPVSRFPTASWCYSTVDVRGRAEQRAAPKEPVWNEKDPAL